MNTLAAIQLFLNNRKALGRTQKTREWYEDNLKRFAEFSPELPTEPEVIEAFLATVPDEQDETRHGRYRTLKAFYRFLHKRYKIPNPLDTELMDPPKRRKKIQPTLEPSQMMMLSIYADSRRDRAILCLLFDCGIRATELVTLQKQCISDDYILVNGKEGQRIVPISEETRSMLLSLAITESDYIFRGQRGNRLTASGLYRIVRKYMDRIGVIGNKRGPHRLRHSFGKSFLENDGEIRTLQKIMGHVNISTTEIYSNLATKAIIAQHHQHTPLRAIHAAAQGNMFNGNKPPTEKKPTTKVIDELEVILKNFNL